MDMLAINLTHIPVRTNIHDVAEIARLDNGTTFARLKTQRHIRIHAVLRRRACAIKNKLTANTLKTRQLAFANLHIRFRRTRFTGFQILDFRTTIIVANGPGRTVRLILLRTIDGLACAVTCQRKLARRRIITCLAFLTARLSFRCAFAILAFA